MRTAKFALALCALTAVACGAKRNTAYLTEQAAGAGAEATLGEQAAAAWDDREDTARLKEALQLYEQLAEKEPDARSHKEHLSRGYYLLGIGHLDDAEEQLAAWDSGASWGERILGQNDAFRACVEGGAEDYACLEHASKDDVPGIYWAYANMGKWAVAKGFATVLKHKNKLKAFIDRVHALDADYYYAAGDRGLGAFYAKVPGFAGGDPEKGREHFEASLAVAPDYFSSKLLMAQYYCVKVQDKELFVKLLNEVIAGDPTVYEDVIPIQKLEQENAKALLEQADDLFE